MAEDYVATLQKEIQRLEQDKKALQSELSTQGGEKQDETNAAAVKKALVPGVPEYISNIHSLALAADSESVRLQANKLLIEWAVTSKLDVGDLDADDDFKALLKAIKKKGDAKHGSSNSGSKQHQ